MAIELCKKEMAYAVWKWRKRYNIGGDETGDWNVACRAFDFFEDREHLDFFWTHKHLEDYGWLYPIYQKHFP